MDAEGLRSRDARRVLKLTSSLFPLTGSAHACLPCLDCFVAPFVALVEDRHGITASASRETEAVSTTGVNLRIHPGVERERMMIEVAEKTNI